MAKDPRKFRAVRLSHQGDAYVQLVADRDCGGNWSEGLRRLLALGAKADMEAHLESGTSNRDRPGDGTRHLRQVAPAAASVPAAADRDSGEGVRLPDGLQGGRPEAAPSGIGDAIGTLYRAGLNPETIEDDGPGAA